MIDIHSKHDNMHKNGIFYALIFINNHIITSIDGMLSLSDHTCRLYMYLETNTPLIVPSGINFALCGITPSCDMFM